MLKGKTVEEFIKHSRGETWNGAISYCTTGTNELGACLDYWSKSGLYVNRDQSAVDADMSKIFADNKSVALMILFGLRLITRKTNHPDIKEIQTGYGRRDEFYKSIIWLNKNYPELLYRNIHLIPVFGCWKDFLNEPLIDVFDRNKVYELCGSNLDNQLLLKYLPKIRSKGEIRSERDKKRSDWAKGFCTFLNIDHRDYRKMKSAGLAHIWQKQMGHRQWNDINFNGVPGKAMFLHITQKGRKDKQTVFERHGQVARLQEWAEAQKTVKFNGYPYELTKAAMKGETNIVQKTILNKQFESLLETFKDHDLGNVLCAVDTSGSMSWTNVNGVTPLDVCLSLGMVFSSLNVGYFKNIIAGFAATSHIVKLEGSFVDRVEQIKSIHAMGSTNFQSVIDLLIKTRTDFPDIPLSDFPETLLVVSDMQFNPTKGNTATNYERAMEKLHSVGLENMRIIWWQVNGHTTDFPAQMDDKGVYIVGGFDPANLKSLLGLNEETKKNPVNKEEKQKETPKDGLLNFLKQPIFSLVDCGKS